MLRVIIRIDLEFTRRLGPTFRMLSRWSRPYTSGEYILYILATLSWHLVSYVDLLKAKTPDEYPGFIIVPDKDTTGIRFGSLTVDYQGNKFELRTLYDILGWIFSVVGNVPVVPVATRENYYYPLMMIARVFSAKLISNTKAPDVWMVSVRPEGV